MDIEIRDDSAERQPDWLLLNRFVQDSRTRRAISVHPIGINISRVTVSRNGAVKKKVPPRLLVASAEKVGILCPPGPWSLASAGSRGAMLHYARPLVPFGQGGASRSLPAIYRYSAPAVPSVGVGGLCQKIAQISTNGPHENRIWLQNTKPPVNTGLCNVHAGSSQVSYYVENC